MGYEYVSSDLQTAQTQFRAAAAALDSATGQAPNAVDAGSSTPAVARAFSAVLRWSVLAAQDCDVIASKVHETNGSYDDIENTNAGLMKKQIQDGERATDPPRRSGNGPV